MLALVVGDARGAASHVAVGDRRRRRRGAARAIRAPCSTSAGSSAWRAPWRSSPAARSPAAWCRATGAAGDARSPARRSSSVVATHRRPRRSSRGPSAASPCSAPLTNLLADPLMALLQPTAVRRAVHRRCRRSSGSRADAAHLLLAALRRRSRTHAAALPGAAPAVLPTTLAAVAGGAGRARASSSRACADRPARAVDRRAGRAGGARRRAARATPARRPHRAAHARRGAGRRDRAAHARAGDGSSSTRVARGDGGDAGRSIVVPYIAHRGGAVALFVLSHPHADHVGGAASLFAALRPRRFLDPGYVGTTPAYLAALRAGARERDPVAARASRRFARGGRGRAHGSRAGFRVDRALDDANLASTVLARARRRRALPAHRRRRGAGGGVAAGARPRRPCAPTCSRWRITAAPRAPRRPSSTPCGRGSRSSAWARTTPTVIPTRAVMRRARARPARTRAADRSRRHDRRPHRRPRAGRGGATGCDGRSRRGGRSPPTRSIP